MRFLWLLLFFLFLTCAPVFAATVAPKIPKSETEIQVSGVVGFVDSSNRFALVSANKNVDKEYLVDIGPLWFHELEITQGDRVTVIGTPQTGILYASAIIRPDESIVKIINPRKPDIDVSDLFNQQQLQLAQAENDSRESDAVVPEGKTLETNEPEFKIEPRKRSGRIRTKFADVPDDDSATSKNETPPIDPKDLELLKELEPAAGQETEAVPESERQSLLNWFKDLNKSSKPQPNNTDKPKTGSGKGDSPFRGLTIDKPQAPSKPLKPQSSYQPQDALPKSIAEGPFGNKKLSDLLPPVTLQSEKARKSSQQVAEKTPEKPPWDAPISFSQLELPPALEGAARKNTSDVAVAATRPYSDRQTYNRSEIEGFEAVDKVMNNALKEHEVEGTATPQPIVQPGTPASIAARDYNKIAKQINFDDRLMPKDEGVDQKYSSKLMADSSEQEASTMAGMKTSDILSIVDQKSNTPQWFGPINQSKVFVQSPEKGDVDSGGAAAVSNSPSPVVSRPNKATGARPDFGVISDPYKKPEVHRASKY